jgi:hypothetical protein
VGQLLEYAANAALYWPPGALQVAFEERLQQDERDPAAELATFLRGGDPETFWALAESNLRGGRVRLVFVADTIPTEPARIIEF